VPIYINTVLEAIEITIYGGEAYWSSDNKTQKPKRFNALPKPIHYKYLGDAGFIIWLEKDFTNDQHYEYFITATQPTPATPIGPDKEECSKCRMYM
jgi:hypothetical protein